MQSIDLFVYFLEFSCLHPLAILLQNSIYFQHSILFSYSPIEFSDFQLETDFLYSDLQLQIVEKRIVQQELDFELLLLDFVIANPISPCILRSSAFAK